MPDHQADRIIVKEIDNGRVQVLLQRAEHADVDVAGKPVAFTSPLSDADREDLRWYLEDYLVAPYAVYEERGQIVQRKLGTWGRALFEAVFGKGPSRAIYLSVRDNNPELTLVSNSTAFLGLPWELLQAPDRPEPLAFSLTTLDRTLHVTRPAIPVPAGEELRVLMVIARPAGLTDIGYQMMARPLLERLNTVSGRVELDVLRPPTLTALKERLQTACDSGQPYHILHFDGHGTFGTAMQVSAGDIRGGANGFLLFEAEDGGDQSIGANIFAEIVREGRVPLVVLNACRSGMLGKVTVEATVATRLLEAGVASVVAMGYSVYAAAAAEFMAEFYEALFAGKSVSLAVAAGRRRLYRNNKRSSPKGMLPLEDWIVPVHYRRRSIAFPQLRKTQLSDKPSLDQELAELRSGKTAILKAAILDPLAPDRPFIGRDAAFYSLELALQSQSVVVVHGPAGTGKTELAKAFGRWWQITGGVDQPDGVIYCSFKTGVANFRLDGVLTAIGLHLFGPEFVSKTQDDEDRRILILSVAKKKRLLIIWDNFESVCSLPDPHGVTPALDCVEQSAFRRFFGELAKVGAKTGIIITSRTSEAWLGDIRRISLGGLTPDEAAVMAEDILLPYAKGRLQRRERNFADLLEWLDGHPLSIRVLLPQLEITSAATLLAALKGNATQLPEGFIGEGRLAALGASLKYSLDHIESSVRERIAALALFEGIVHEKVLDAFGTQKNAPLKFAAISGTSWATWLTHLASIGLLTSLGNGMYTLHPALPAYLMAEWRQLAGQNFDTERSDAEMCMLSAYTAHAISLFTQMHSGDASRALIAIDRQRRTIGRLLKFALARRLYRSAQLLLQPLGEFWDKRGLSQEAAGWIERCQASVEESDGSLPDLATDSGQLWLYVVGYKASSALADGDLARAENIYETIRKHVESSEIPFRDRQLAVVYHQMGGVAQDKGDLESAKAWYEKSKEIKLNLQKTLGQQFNLTDQRSLARTYDQLGKLAQSQGDLNLAQHWHERALDLRQLVDEAGVARTYRQFGELAQIRGEFDAAEIWHKKSLSIVKKIGDFPGLRQTYHQLGKLAFERGSLDSAADWHDKALQIAEQMADKLGRAYAYQELGRVAEAKCDMVSAQNWSQKASEIREGLNRPKRQVD